MSVSVSVSVRRLVVLLVVGGLALAALVLPAAAQTAPPPQLSIFTWTTPHPAGCANPGDNFDLVIGGATNQPTVSLVMLSPTGAAINKGSAANNGGGWQTSLVWNFSQTGVYEVRATAGAAAPVSGFLEVPCQAPTLEYAPTCFAPGFTGTVTMTGRHFEPFDTPHTVTYDLGGSELQRAIRQVADNHGVVTTKFTVTPSNRPHPGEITNGQRTVVATGSWSPCPPATTTTSTSTPGSTTTSTTEPDETTTTAAPGVTTTTRPGGPTTTIPVPPVIDLPAPTPGATLTLAPRIGPTGFVTAVRGTGFPPSATVELHWQPGVGTATALTGADGTFATRALVLPGDQLGPRALVATSGPTTAYDAFLVVPSTVQPSGGQSVAQINRVRRFLKR